MKMPELGEVRKPSKTLAGVTPIAVMTSPRKCLHGTCIYCPSLNVPQSYTPLSPPVIRASMLDYNPYKQVEARLKAFKLMNHPTDKIELIIMGGTFFEFPRDYKIDFVKQCYDALNQATSKSLEEAKKLNETAKHRCVALCIETRPDTCSEKQIREALGYGATRLELGVQNPDDKIYKLINRGHKVKDVTEATARLKNSGFKVGYHIMPGLPGSNPKKDIAMVKKLFSDENFKPDQLKIYPCQVIKGSLLEQWHKQGKYKPYTKEQIETILVKMLQEVPEYCRVMRIMREIPPAFLIAGTERIDLRKDVESFIRTNKIKLNEIRFREIGFAMRDLRPGKEIDTNLEIKKTEYKASKGKEIFLQVTNKDNILFGLLRMRFPHKTFLPELKGGALVRELHVYGQTVPIGEKGKEGEIQHRGIGKNLMQQAEQLARQAGYKKLAVISGIGAREYYRKLGYNLERDYMIKSL
jgi:elongator complex protein 3